MNEFDIPCSDCGGTLVERTVAAGNGCMAAIGDRPVTVAECPNCGARYYPEETHALLSEPGPNTSIE